MEKQADKTYVGFTKQQAATAVAILFHLIGLAGILFFDRQFFIRLSAFNLLLMFLLICFTQRQRNLSFYLFILICFLIGMMSELVGTSTGLLFGEYAYGDVLGPSFRGVPFVIGLNWFMVLYCCGVSIQMMLERFSNHTGLEMSPFLKNLSLLVDGATLAVALDWLMEPVAIRLGYWQWQEGIPVFNYACWFLVSMVMLLFFRFLSFDKENKFAVHLLLIQSMFFLLLRTFL